MAARRFWQWVGKGVGLPADLNCKFLNKPSKVNPMKIKDPRITVQNTDGGKWLVTAEGLLSGEDGMENVTFTVLVPRGEQSLPEITRLAVFRAIELLEQHQDASKKH